MWLALRERNKRDEECLEECDEYLDDDHLLPSAAFALLSSNSLLKMDSRQEIR